MSITINSSLAATQSSLSLKRASDRLSKSIQRMSSGNRIVSPSEDAGGLAVAMKLESSLRRASATMMNTQNGVSFLQMQDGALTVVGEIVDRMSELKSFYNDVSKNDEDRENYNYEFRELQRELVALKAQKFNGVSLFSTDISSGGGINIMTSDDGLGDPIELSRMGLFENFKSKYGADGKLNTGSHGSYRQLVGGFLTDGGKGDANPGFATRDYNEGDVVFMDAPSDSASGYYMALRNVAEGARIEDSEDLTSNWIHIADKSGNGFSEAYSDAPTYDMRNLQFNSKGEAVSYLKGDIIKVQAHWNDPNSFVFLQAQNDVPQNILIDELLLNGIGSGKYLDFIGRRKSDDQKGKPASQFVIPNSEHSTPLSITSRDATTLRSVMNTSESNNFTPTFVQTSDQDIYRPVNSDWGLKQWTEGIGLYKPGDLIYDASADTESNNFLYQVSSKVKGSFSAGNYSEGEIAFSSGKWAEAPADGDAENFDGKLYTRIVGLIDNFKDGDTVKTENAFKASDNQWYKIDQAELDGTFESEDEILALTLEDGTYFVSVGGEMKKLLVSVTGRSLSTPSEEELKKISQNVTTSIEPASGTTPSSDIWREWSEVNNPLSDSSFATNVTSDYADLDNEDVWSKTYYGALNEISVNTDYSRGDNIFYQGKHYVYVSHLTSSDESLGGEDGVNDFEQLLLSGAIKELGVYVDMTGAGGSSDKAKDSFYQANQSLTFINRLPGSGEVQTSGVARMGNPMQNGDGIFNSIDDQLYNALDAGNDGIFGTMDDFYSTTPYESVALKATHIDADADNNRDLLDLSNDLADFSVADFVDYIQSVANFRAVNGGTMSRLNYANRILEENRSNLEAAHGRIMNADIALEASNMARQNVIIQASAAMVTQANQMNQVVLQLLQ